MPAHTGHIHYILVAFLDEPLLAIGSIDFISLFLMVVCILSGQIKILISSLLLSNLYCVWKFGT